MSRRRRFSLSSNAAEIGLNTSSGATCAKHIRPSLNGSPVMSYTGYPMAVTRALVSGHSSRMPFTGIIAVTGIKW